MATATSNEATRSVLRVPRDGVIALLLASVVLANGSWWIVGGVCGVYHDDAIYVSTAKALAEGDGYRLINLPDRPLQTKYPVLLPAVLAVVWLIWPAFPENLIAMQGICLLSGAAAVGLGYLYAVRYRYFPRGIAVAAALLCASAPVFVYYGTLVLSEMPFALLLVLVCWCFEAALSGRPMSRPRRLLLGVVLTLPFWCRTVGLALVPAGLLLVRRGRRPTRWVSAGAVAALVPWAVWTAIGLAARQADEVESYYTNYLGWYASLGLPLLARVFAGNAERIVWSAGGLGLAGINRALLEAGIAPVVMMLALGVVGWIAMVRQCIAGRVLPTMVGAYVLLVAVWPWPPDRFMVPILPILVGYLLLGISQALGDRAGRRRRLIAVSIVGVLVAANLACLNRFRSLSHRTGFPQNRVASAPVCWDSYQRVFDWLRVHSDSEAVIATEMDPMFYLYTSRRGFRPFISRPGAMFYGTDGPLIGTVDELERALEVHEPQYVVVTPMQFFDEPFQQLVLALRARHPGWLKPVYEDAQDERFSVYEVQPAARSMPGVSAIRAPGGSAATVQ
jgi:hypothetical protein